MALPLSLPDICALVRVVTTQVYSSLSQLRRPAH
jgi:hypothetical protein